MRIRASVMTPILAMLTVVALIATGIALGQARGGDASATLIDSTPSFAAVAGTDATVVAEAGPPATDGSLEQPIVQSVQVVQSAPADPVIVAGGQKPATSPTKPPTKPAAKPPTKLPTTVEHAPDPPVTEAGDDGSGSAEPEASHHYEEPESDSD